MTEPFRTVHVELGSHFLGGPQQVIYLVQGLQERGHFAHLICPTNSGTHREAEALGLNVIPVPLATDLDVTLIFRLARIFRSLNPHVVHLHSRRGADLLGGIAARLAKVPAVITTRRIDNPVRGIFSPWKFGPLCDHIISISDGVTRALLEGGIPPEKVTLVRSVLDIRKYEIARNPVLRSELGVPDDALLLGIIAQLIPRKGHAFLLDAMPEILAHFPQVILLVFGKGALRKQLEKKVAQLGLESHVRFAGFRCDMPQVLRELDLVVHPAIMEGLGIAILQAQASHVPVVASAVGGIPEIITDGVNGLLIPPGDVPALTQAVIRLLGDPVLRQRMGTTGRQTVEEKFSLDSMIEGVLAVYRMVWQQCSHGNELPESKSTV